MFPRDERRLAQYDIATKRAYIPALINLACIGNFVLYISSHSKVSKEQAYTPSFPPCPDSTTPYEFGIGGIKLLPRLLSTAEGYIDSLLLVDGAVVVRNECAIDRSKRRREERI